MFETAEVGHAVSKTRYAKEEPRLHADLLAAQRRLREAGFPVIVIVSGVETAGKSQVVNKLNEWLDARGVQTAVFWDESDEERERPFHWRFWRQLPPGGKIGVLFGSWYTQPIVNRALRRIRKTDYESRLERIADLERMLTDDGAVLVKLWFHVSRKEQASRLKEARKKNKRKLTPFEKDYSKLYDRFARVSEAAIHATDVGHAPWHIIDAADHRYRDLAAGRILLKAMCTALDRPAVERRRDGREEEPRPGNPRTLLDRVDLSRTVSRQRYEKQLDRLQAKLNRLSWAAHDAKRSSVAVFEGWDAAGKGGAIRRVVAAMDARLFRVISIAAPTDEERAHHYLWRFWRHIPRAGYFTIYDRSWYGRVLVERVEKLARPAEWGRAYREINTFERLLAEHGIVISKFWLHISPEEQLRRFRERERVAHKKHKITDEDWRNRDKWNAYEAAVDEMVARTGTSHAPWTVVAANDKKQARLEVLKTLCERLEAAL